MCAFTAVTVAALKSRQTGHTISNFSSSSSAESLRSDFDDSPLPRVDLRASRRRESHSNLETVFETSSATSSRNGQNFNTLSICGGGCCSCGGCCCNCCSSTLKISAMERFFGAFDFDIEEEDDDDFKFIILMWRRSSLIVCARHPSMCAFTAVSVAALNSRQTGQTISNFSSSLL
ncbi:hypothetical protein V8G54_037571 [Vigna mungo]|uniref:Uncharacterized protein n=1 Tax=Vigna mungo TaxID=3915 RepID=A0AAQ3MJ55_VIGMU